MFYIFVSFILVKLKKYHKINKNNRNMDSKADFNQRLIKQNAKQSNYY